MKISRIPLAVALSSALAFAAGCAADRDEHATDERIDATMEADRQPAAPPVGPVTADPQATADRMDDGSRSDQPMDDTWITTKVKAALLADTDVSGLAIDVETVNGVVMLSGQVDEQSQVDHATRIARGIEGAGSVDASRLTAAAR